MNPEFFVPSAEKRVQPPMWVSASHSILRSRYFYYSHSLGVFCPAGAENAYSHCTNFYIAHYSTRLFGARCVSEFFAPTARKRE